MNQKMALFAVTLTIGFGALADEPFAYGRHVPERKDDFAWENDRIAFRMYGPALEASGEVSSGIDVWVKSVRTPVIDAWYKHGKYHKDHGEGGDFYKVGPTTGCGGMAIWSEESLHFSKNWREYRILQNGPDRVSFELTYAPWEVDGKTIRETKTITLEAGSNFNQIESRFEVEPSGPMTVAIGVVERRGRGEVTTDRAAGTLSYWEPETGANGHIGCALVIDPDRIEEIRHEQGHHFILVTVPPGEPLVYYAGAGWSKGDYPTRAAWDAYVAEFAANSINSPEK